MFETN
jgi:hypothetical protein